MELTAISLAKGKRQYKKVGGVWSISHSAMLDLDYNFVRDAYFSF